MGMVEKINVDNTDTSMPPLGTDQAGSIRVPVSKETLLDVQENFKNLCDSKGIASLSAVAPNLPCKLESGLTKGMINTMAEAYPVIEKYREFELMINEAGVWLLTIEDHPLFIGKAS